MLIIAGLGNPGKEYENTRHNAGFMVMDALAEKIGADISEKKHKALCGKSVIGGEKVVLMKPQTYMNSSGESIRAAADYYKVDPGGYPDRVRRYQPCTGTVTDSRQGKRGRT